MFRLSRTGHAVLRATLILRRIGRIGAHVLAGLTAIVVGLPMSPCRRTAQDSARRGSDLDSRTVPHPEWAQISGQIEQTSTVQSKNGDASVRALIRPTERGHVTVDFGTAAAGSFRPTLSMSEVKQLRKKDK